MADEHELESQQPEEMADYEEMPLDGEPEHEEEYSDFEEQGFFQRYKSLFIWAILGAILVIFTVYQLISLFETPEEKTTDLPTEIQATKTTPVPVKPTPAPKASQPMVPAAPPAAPAPPPAAPAMPTTPTLPSMPTASTNSTMPAAASAAAAMTSSAKSVVMPATPALAPAAKSAPSAAVTATPTKPVIPPVLPSVSAPQSITMKAPAPAANTGSNNSDLTEQLADIEDDLSAQQRLISSQQTMTASQMKEMHKQLQAMNNTLQSLRSAVKQRPAPVVKVVHEKHHDVAPHHKAAPKAMPMDANLTADTANMSYNYYVKAIVPGRAWIQMDGDQTMSVAEGDTVPGYGRITKIDAEHGMVATSSGRMIPFGISAD